MSFVYVSSPAVEQRIVNGKPGYAVLITGSDEDEEILFEDYATLTEWSADLADEIASFAPHPDGGEG